MRTATYMTLCSSTFMQPCIYYALDLFSRLVMLHLLASPKVKGGDPGGTYKSKKENWLGLLPYSYTNRLAR